MQLSSQPTFFAAQGYYLQEDIYTDEELMQIADTISAAHQEGPDFRRTGDLFAIRRFLKQVPAVKPLLFNKRLASLLETCFGTEYSITKAIYFDKPPASNWFVAWHQDLTIAVRERQEVAGFSGWTTRQGQYAVQPPVAILHQNFTVRIHLDDTTAENGALKVIPGSHRKGIYRPETIDWTTEQEVVCAIRKGGVMLMSPLTLHASGRTVNGLRRRVIHIECSRATLPAGLDWAEQELVN